MRKFKQWFVTMTLGLSVLMLTGCQSNQVTEKMLTSDGEYWRVDNLPEAISILQFKKEGQVKCYAKNYADSQMGKYQFDGKTLTVRVDMYNKRYTFDFTEKNNHMFKGNVTTNQGKRKVTLISVDDDYIKQAKEGNKRRGF